MATFGTFTSAVLTAGELNTAGGAWTTYTPTYANFTLGNGTVTYAKYEQVGRTVTVKFKVTLGSTSVMGTAPTISLPATASTSGEYCGTGSLLDSSAGTTWPCFVQLASTTTAQPEIINNGAFSYNPASPLALAVPFGANWTTSDTWQMQFTYEAAADGT